jgi:methylenetetrahydrofolate reductase (NADPH)
MSHLDPLFTSFTWGASGSTVERTGEMCAISQSVFGLETCMHLTCTNVNRNIIKGALNVGILNLIGKERLKKLDMLIHYEMD